MLAFILSVPLMFRALFRFFPLRGRFAKNVKGLRNKRGLHGKNKPTRT